MRGLPSRLLVVTDRSRTETPEVAAHRLIGTLDRLMAAGASWIWFRERDLGMEARRALGRRVVERVRAGGGTLTIGGDPALALELGADGVHLPSATTPAELAEARMRLPRGLVGVSAHSVRDIAAAAGAGADYATLSPIYATASKPGYGPALGPEALTLAAAHGMPVIALGGITPDNAAACRAAGAAGIAVMGGLMRATDPAAEARTFLARAGEILNHP